MSKNIQTKELSNKNPLNIGGVSISLYNALENSIKKYIELFEKKHELSFDFWIADLSGTVACFSMDYYVNFEDIRLDLEKDVPKDLFFDWYDLAMDLGLEDKPIINYYTFLKTRNLN